MLPPNERGDAINMKVAAYFLLGDYAQCIATIKLALVHKRPDESLIYLTSGPSNAMFAVYFNGQWDDVMYIAPFHREIWEQQQDDLGALMGQSSAYIALLFVAAAREDRPTADMAFAALNQFFQRLADKGENDAALSETFRSVLKAYQEDDALSVHEPLVIDTSIDSMVFFWMIFLSEHGMVSPDVILDTMARQEMLRNFFSLTRNIALALKTDDNNQLMKAIDAAEAAQFIVHAARMRIVLAQRTGDRSQLERARVVLERIQDRRFLRRLEEVAEVIR